MHASEKVHTRVDNDTCDRGSVTTDPFGGAVHYENVKENQHIVWTNGLTDDICTKGDRPNEISSHSKGIVHDQGYAVIMGNLGITTKRQS